MSNALTGMFVAEDVEEFLSLEETTPPPVEVKPRKSRKPLSKTLKPLYDSIIPEDSESESLDEDEVVLKYSPS